MPIDPPDWSIWSRADLAMLYEAIALSLEMSPKTFRIAHDTVGNFDFLNSDEKKAIGTRVTLSESHLGGKLKASGEIYQGSLILDSKVHLTDFASFATEMGWELPTRFPGRKERDEVGPLIPNATRLRPEWSFYADIPNPLLWALVAMACDIDPRNIDVLNPAERHVPDLVQFWKRFTIAQAQVEAKKLPVVDIGAKLPGDFNFATAVSWDAFIRWMRGLLRTWELPEEFPAERTNMPVQEEAVPTPEDTTDARSMDTRVRNKLLIMIAAMAKAAYDVDDIAKSAKELANDAKKIGLKMDHRTASKYLKEASDLLADKGNSGE